MKISKILNLGILAHVDAGKTSLTERLLYNAGVVKTLGSVDSGDTQTDSLALERQRGITIKSAVVSFMVNDLKINLIDTPGHPDFIAEVERSLAVLDTVVLVISAVEGIQPQTRVLMRALKTMRIPTFIFVNKVDRMGARDNALVLDIKTKLFSNIVTMNDVEALGNRNVSIKPHDSRSHLHSLQTALSERDEGFLKLFVNSPEKLTLAVCEDELTKQIKNMDVVPIFFGSAITGSGVRELADALAKYHPATTSSTRQPVSGLVFKIERGSHDEKVVYVRLYSGQLHIREQVSLSTNNEENSLVKPTALQVFDNGKVMNVATASAGEIVKIWGLHNATINAYIGDRPGRFGPNAHFARPNFEVIVSPSKSGNRTRLNTALQQISEQDPFIAVRQSKRDGAISLQLCGEVQREVIEDMLLQTYGIEVTFSAIKTICIERPIGTAEAVKIGVQGDPYLGTVGLRIEPGPVGSGVHYRRANHVLGTMPDAFFVAIEETVYETLQEGLHGWEVTDCVVTLILTGFWPRQSHAHATFDKSMSSTAGDFRAMTPLALMDALRQADTAVYEPLNHFELEIPQPTLAPIMQKLTEAEARLDRPPETDGNTIKLQGLIPARRTFAFERSLPDLTGGEGVLVARLGGYKATHNYIS